MRINRDGNKYAPRRGKERAFWWESEMEHEAYETAAPQAHTIIFSIPMAKKCYCSSNIFRGREKKKIFSEIFTNLGEPALLPDQGCGIDGEKIELAATSSGPKVRLKDFTSLSSSVFWILSALYGSFWGKDSFPLMWAWSLDNDRGLTRLRSSYRHVKHLNRATS